MSVSVAIIARNSEDVIERCLDSVKSADEIIVLDTGSDNDETINIARKYTEKVYTYYGCNEGGKKHGLLESFADARNKCLDYCTMTHVLTIDTDEVLETPMKHLKAFTGDALNIRCIADGTGEEHVQPRLYRNLPSVRWRGAAHNYLNLKAEESNYIIRYYTNNQKKRDPDRTLRILKRYVRKHRDNAREMYYLAKEYYRRNDYKKAYKVFYRYIQKSKFMAEKCDALVMMARCLMYMQKYGKALNSCLSAITINPHHREAMELLADMSNDTNRMKWRHLARGATNSGALFIRPDKRKVVTILAESQKKEITDAIRAEVKGSLNIEYISPENLTAIGRETAMQRIKDSDLVHMMGTRGMSGVKIPKSKTLKLDTDNVQDILQAYSEHIKI